jgi:small redox-active disulfide protein 2
MRIQVLGSGCPKCRKLAENARVAADAAGLDYVLEKVEDLGEIVAMGVMSTPALAVDGKVVLAGRAASPEEIAGLLEPEGSGC